MEFEKSQDIDVGDSEHREPNADTTSHVAAPELSHPGESASNGLAGRSVGEFVDQLKT